MPRRRRKDYPGAWWHISNKGVAGRSLFTCDKERIHFLMLLACAVRKGWFEVHAYCLMTNHFHLMIRSPNGDISAAMQWVEDSYARWFNLRHERRGPLFIGRFWGKLIHTMTYRRAVFAYIHANPDHAGLEIPPGGYPWSSKRHYLRGCGCPWLSRSFGSRLSPALVDGAGVPAELVQRWMQAPGQDVRDIDGLLGRPWERAQAWMKRNARLADGATRPRFLICPKTLRAVLRELARAAPDTTVLLGRRRHGIWKLLWPGMLRTACALPFREIADRSDASMGAVHNRAHQHSRALLEDERYAAMAGRALERCLRQDYELLAG